MGSCLITKPIRSATPTFEPVSRDEAKKQCEIPLDLTDHDPHFDRLIETSREAIETETGLVCATGTYTLKLTEFPGEDYIEIRGIRPVTSVTSLTYVDSAGTTQTLSASSYVLDTATVTPIVRLAYGQSWPTVRGDINGITLTVVAGYASQAAVPALVKQAVLVDIRRRFDARDGATKDDAGYERLLNLIGRCTYP